VINLVRHYPARYVEKAAEGLSYPSFSSQ